MHRLVGEELGTPRIVESRAVDRIADDASIIIAAPQPHIGADPRGFAELQEMLYAMLVIMPLK